MSLDSIPQLSLGTAVLIIFLVCVCFVMLRGMTRVITGSVVLALSAWAGFWVWQNAPALSVATIGKSIGLINNSVSIVTFLVCYLTLRKMVRAISHPLSQPSDGQPTSGGGLLSLGFRILLAIIPTAIICVIIAVLGHHAGSVAEVKSFAKKSRDGKPSHPPTYTEQLKSSLEKTIPADWLKKLDPLAESSRITLAKIITAESETPKKPAIDPKTGKAIPRAIIVNDPELQSLARDGKFGTLLRHPLLTKALNDPKVQSLIKDFHL